METAVTSVRLSPERQDRLDQLAARWGCSRAEVIGKFLDGSTDQVLAQVEAAAYRYYDQLPVARRYKLIERWEGLIGFEYHSFGSGHVLSRDSHRPELIQALFDRHAKLVPLPD